MTRPDAPPAGPPEGPPEGPRDTAPLRPAAPTGAPLRARADKWLWQARFFRSRALAAAAVTAGHVRLNGARLAKPAAPVGPGDVLTFVQGAQVRVVRIAALGQRRGPAAEAQRLYQDLDTPRPSAAAPAPGSDAPPPALD